jgi:hypothetical protein
VPRVLLCLGCFCAAGASVPQVLRVLQKLRASSLMRVAGSSNFACRAGDELSFPNGISHLAPLDWWLHWNQAWDGSDMMKSVRGSGPTSCARWFATSANVPASIVTTDFAASCWTQVARGRVTSRRALDAGSMVTSPGSCASPSLRLSCRYCAAQPGSGVRCALRWRIKLLTRHTQNARQSVAFRVPGRGSDEPSRAHAPS